MSRSATDYRNAAASSSNTHAPPPLGLDSRRRSSLLPLQEITPRVWVAPVNAILPESGFHVWWDAMWQERAPGVSMNFFAFMGKGHVPHDVQLDILQDKLDNGRIVQVGGGGGRCGVWVWGVGLGV